MAAYCGRNSGSTLFCVSTNSAILAFIYCTYKCLRQWKRVVCTCFVCKKSTCAKGECWNVMLCGTMSCLQDQTYAKGRTEWLSWQKYLSYPYIILGSVMSLW